ncbi:hypothetical protein KBP30_14805 [Streptomyces sp. Go40/10]|uniref:hypothetical protein n=1 Tax=Streptomyces sp. Go40/10 TaxID=2825844 RepID=UPI001E44172C|nr:hypothetical protein [Streptomyces sp. Go40/10]UFR02374.1 hypothetical protein KBP30_14805 [Streptomyces sp. Go40/10]
MKHMISTCAVRQWMRGRRLAAIVVSAGAVAGGVMLPAVTASAAPAPTVAQASAHQGYGHHDHDHGHHDHHHKYYYCWWHQGYHQYICKWIYWDNDWD